MIEDLHNKLNENNFFNELDTGQKVFQRSAQYKVPRTVSKEEALQQLKAKIASGVHANETFRDHGIRRLYQIVSIAALMLLLFGIWHFFIQHPLVDVVAVKGQHSEYQLPDGSMVSINAESKISFRKDQFNKNRYLTLEGEAFFNVKKGNSFTINTKFADIRVLGTSFNVLARENSFKVSCLTGKILVTLGNQSLTIIPGESVILVNHDLSKFQDKNISIIANWRKGEFYFENTPLTTIFKEIARQFNVIFVVPKMNEKYFTGSFTDKNLVNALDIVCIPMGLTYEIGGNSKIFISEKSR